MFKKVRGEEGLGESPTEARSPPPSPPLREPSDPASSTSNSSGSTSDTPSEEEQLEGMEISSPLAKEISPSSGF